MREALEVISDLQSRYVDLNEFKKTSCIEINDKKDIEDASDDSSDGESPDARSGGARMSTEVEGGGEAANMYERVSPFKLRVNALSASTEKVSQKKKQTGAAKTALTLQRKKRKLRNSLLNADNLI